ncbi:MAG: ATP-binding protein [Actinobacteria bacterium]|nr:ATP-binding protein [Actinomycetota bacterium]
MAHAGQHIARTGPHSVEAWPVSSVMPALAALATAPSAARAHVRVTLATWQMSDLADAVELVVSELVANGVNASTDRGGVPRYVAGRMPVIRLCLLTDWSRLVTEVWDQAPGVPVHLRARPDDESGRGLSLVDAITGSRWGWYPARYGPGKCVWAEFAR